MPENLALLPTEPLDVQHRVWKKLWPVVQIATCGSCKPNPGPGGWAAILRFDGVGEKVVTGRSQRTTSQRMELRAVIEGLQVLKRPCKVSIFSDSRYVVNGGSEWIFNWYRDNWVTSAGNPVANRDLWERFWKQSAPHDLEFTWVAGHGGNRLNERVHDLAVEARKR